MSPTGQFAVPSGVLMLGFSGVNVNHVASPKPEGLGEGKVLQASWRDGTEFMDRTIRT